MPKIFSAKKHSTTRPPLRAKPQLRKASKIRVFKTPSKENPDEVHIGIPTSIQDDPMISEIALTQIEVLSPPKSLLDLFRKPKERINKPVDASKNVQKSSLEPGYKFKAVPKGKIPWFLVKPLEIEEVIVPDGFVHLDNFNDWEIFNYNKSYHLTDRDFQPLPDEKRLPIKHRYHLIIRGNKFRAVHDKQIQKVNVYYRRISKFSADYEWVFWESMVRTEKEWKEWAQEGEYVFRAVPFFENNKPMNGYKEFRVIFPESETLEWSAIQVSKEIFQLRMEGQLGKMINYVEILEKGKILSRKKLFPDKDGRIEETFRVKDVSNDKSPRLEYRFYRKDGAFKSYRSNSFQDLDRHYADELVGFTVKKVSNTRFSINIQDPRNLLYTPFSRVAPFSGQQWNDGIQSSKLICKLIINRHQDGEVTPYGSYYVNVTGETTPEFLEKPPFGTKIEKINRGFQFEFEDTQEFRAVANLDNPDMGKKLAYEFRLSFWSCGIEESIRTRNVYSFIKETPVIVKGKRRSYKYNYNTWKEEHPRKKYTGVVPVDVEYISMNHHLRYGTIPKAYVLTADKTPLVRTRHIEIEKDGWEVLYYYHDKEDEILEFPYYKFNIKVPMTSVLEIEKLEVFVDNETKKDISLGIFHPCENIEILDFVGYFEARKLITRKIPLRRAVTPLRESIVPKTNLFSAIRPTRSSSRDLSPLASKPRGIRSSRNKLSNIVSSSKSTNFRKSRKLVKESPMGNLPSMRLNTAKRKLEAKISNSRINNSISRVVERGVLKYRVDIYYKDGKTATRSVSVFVSERPKMPEEPPDNLSISVGNKTFAKSTIQLPTNAAKAVSASISQISMSKNTDFSPRKRSSPTGISRSKILRGFKK